MLRYKTKLDQV